MTRSKTIVWAGVAALIVTATAMVAKPHFFPTVNDSFFEPDTDKLQRLPANLAVVRPTHFPRSPGKIRHVHDGDSLARTVGRNVSLRDLIAEAYDCDPGRVVLPPGTLKGHFDFLVTMAQTRKHLRSAIEGKPGYVARRETRDTDVLALKVEDANLPGLILSAEGEEEDVSYKDGRLYFKHQPLSILLKGLGSGLNQPIVDETGLTNFYNFSVTWNQAIDQKMQDGGFDLDGVRKVLSGWGLRLDPGRTTLDMFVVEKAR